MNTEMNRQCSGHVFYHVDARAGKGAQQREKNEQQEFWWSSNMSFLQAHLPSGSFFFSFFLCFQLSRVLECKQEVGVLWSPWFEMFSPSPEGQVS